jgi:broad specificity phosphatase PhoE
MNIYVYICICIHVQENVDWVSTAKRPQDTPLSAGGIEQAREVGKQLKDSRTTKILCSPMIRTLMTALEIASVIGL